MITVNKANPTQGEITSSLTGSTGDGAGLHLEDGGQVTWSTPTAADFGTSDFSVEFILNQTEENTNGNYIYFSHTSGNNRLYLHNDKSANDIAVIFVNSSGSSTGLDFTLPYDMSADYGTPTHYVFTFDRDGDVTLYKNGNSVASVSISAASAINLGDGNTAVGRFGSSSTYGVLGTFYRFRTWNKLVDAKALFERADVDFADQYGEQNLVDAAASAFTSGTYGWTAYGTNTIANVSNNLTITYGNNEQGAYNYLRDSSDLNQDLVVGKKYRLRITAKYAGGASGVSFRLNDGDALTNFGTLTTSFAEYVHEFTAGSGAASAYLKLSGLATDNVVTIDTWQVDEIGCVSDYQTQWADPTQSLTVQDASGNADGTCSASGVTQVQPVVQLNSTSARIGTTQATPADGELLVSSRIGVNADPSEPLHIDGDGDADILLTRTNEASSGTLGRIFFGANDGDQYLASVEGYQDGATDAGGLIFSTEATGGSRVNRLTIDSSGNVTQNGAVLKVERDDNAPSLDLYNNKSGPTANTALGYYSFKGKAPSGAYSSFANIGGFVESVSSGNYVSGYLTFNTTDNGTATVERMRISSTGQTTMTASSTAVLKVNRTTSDGDAIIVEAAGADRIRLGTEGITFPNGGTAPGSGDANRLDYYEEGTWTPTLPNGGTLTTDMKTYTRIGNLCTVHFYVSSIAPSATSSRFEIGGLPFTISDDTNYYPAGTIGYCGDGDFHDAGLVGLTDANSVYFHNLDGASGWLSNNQVISRFSGSTNALICTLTYRVK